MNLTVTHVPAGALFLHQVLIDSGLPHLVVHAASSDHWGVRHTRSNTVDTYVLLSVLRRHRPRHLDDGPLGSRVEETGVPTKHWTETKPPVRSIFLFFLPIVHIALWAYSRPLTDDMLTMDPRPALRISGMAYRLIITMLVTLMRKSRSQAARSMRVASPTAPPTPTDHTSVFVLNLRRRWVFSRSTAFSL